MVSNNFKTSINVKFDMGKEEFVQSYLPTPSHAESIIGISEGFIKKGGNSAHIMMGPYGSGKSLVATILSNFVTKSIGNSMTDILIKKYNKVHQEVSRSLKALKDIKKEYIPIILSGSEGVFSDVLISVIMKELEERNIQINLPGEVSEVKEKVRSWKLEYKNTYDQFVELLKQRGFTVKEWESCIDYGVSDEINWFKTVYPELTSGAVFVTNTGSFFLEKLEAINGLLNERNLGLFIIYDEFGRFLQNLDQREIPKAMQDLQNLAELANRSKGALQVLLISHKSMSQYMFGFNAEFQSEFQRIEKRFTSYFVESDPATYYRLVEQFVSNNYEQNIFAADTYETSIMNLRKFNLFEELNQQEVEKIVVEGAYPIHPAALYLLPNVSKVFGQNERTLFTFLASNETGGLKNYVAKNTLGYFYPHNLFDFFFKSGLNEYQYDENFHSLKIYNGISKKMEGSKSNANELNVLKFITLWEISHSNSVYKMDADLISFATGLSDHEVDTVLNWLKSKKFIRYNGIMKLWELAEGSALVVDEIISEKLNETKITEELRFTYLDKQLSRNYLFSTAYNDSKDMTRFMKVNIIGSDVFLDNQTNIESLINSTADGHVYMIILERKEDYNRVLKKTELLQDDLLIFSIVTESFSTIKGMIDQAIIVEQLLEDKVNLSEYEHLKDELLISLEEFIYKIKNYLKIVFEFKTNVIWIYKGEELKLSNLIDLEGQLTKIMEDKYPLTPIVRNDAVNRMYVKGIQKRSLVKVLDCVLKSYNEANIGIEGHGPDYLIYATVIKNNQIDFNDLDGLENHPFRTLRKKLINQLYDNKKASLKEISDILVSEPFGVRKPLIPLFVVMLLRDKWDQIIFNRNSMFVPSSEAESIYEMFNEPEEYYYDFHDYSPKMLMLMEQVEDYLRNYVSEYVLEKTPLIRTSSALLNWLRSLPRHTQITERMPKNLVLLKDTIRKSEVHPLASIETLTEIYGEDFGRLKAEIINLENYHGQFVQIVKNDLLVLLEISSYENRDEFLEAFTDEQIMRNRFLQSLKDNNDLHSFLYKYIGTELENWSDTNYELFDQQIKNDLESLSSQNQISEDVIELTYNNKYKQIKKLELSPKSEIIYNNLNRIIKNAGRGVAREEIEYLIYKLLNDYVE